MIGVRIGRCRQLLLVAALLCASSVAVAQTTKPIPSPGLYDKRILFSLGVTFNLLIWPAGSTIRFCFFPDEPELRKTFVDVARQWLEFANIRFDFSTEPDFRACPIFDRPDPRSESDIKVRFTNALMGAAAGNSEIGTTSLSRPWNHPTLRIASRSLDTGLEHKKEQLVTSILHEVGHALGLPHEHQHPDSVCQQEYLYATICQLKESPGLPADVNAALQRNRVELYRMQERRHAPVAVLPFPYLPLPYDVNSIMHYRVWPGFLKRGNQSPCYAPQSRNLSKVDRLRISVLYPGETAVQREFLRGSIEVFRQTMKVMGLSRPTAARLASMLEKDMHRRHDPAGLSIRVDDLGLTEDDTSELEALFANPVPPPLPAACK